MSFELDIKLIPTPMNFLVKIEQIYKDDFSAMRVWLIDRSADKSQTEDPLFNTIVVICYNEELKQKLLLSNGDNVVVSDFYIQEFKHDFNDNIQNLLTLTTRDWVNNIIQMVELFIKECVSYNQSLRIE